MRPAVRSAALLTLAALLAAGCATQSASPGSRASGTSTGSAAQAGQGSTSASTGGSSTTSPTGSGSGTSQAAATPTVRELPRGGTTVFPRYRLVGYSGAPNSPALGRLGVGRLDDRVAEIGRLGRAYARGRTVLPVLELITTVVHGSPGRDGLYRSRMKDDVIGDYLSAARRGKGILLLNIQPGRARFIDEVKAYEKWLKEPDVGLALDPEWAVGPGQVPGRVFGRTSGAELDGVATYVSGLVATYNLPQKVLVYHQLHVSIVRGEKALRAHPGIALVKSVDGIGTRAEKVGTYNRVIAGKPAAVHAGFKLFYQEDRRLGPLMTPAQVMALVPMPEYVLYE